ISQERLNRAMTLNIIAGSGGTIWMTTASPQPIFNVFFMNHLGASSTQLGLLVAIAQLMAVFQLASIFIYSRVDRRKGVFVSFHVIHRLFGFVLSGVSFWAASHGIHPTHIGTVFIGLTASWILMNMSSSGWWGWIADLIPGNVRATFFGRRSAIINAVNIAWFFGVTMMLDIVADVSIFTVYGVVFAIAAAAGVADILIHTRIPEPQQEPHGPMTVKDLLEPLRSRNFVWFSVAIGVSIFSTNVFAPFAAPYITNPEEIGAPNTWLGIMFVMSQVIWVGVVAPWGVIMDRFGRKPVVILGSLSALSWIGYFILTSHNYVYVLPVIAIAGGLLAPGFGEGVNQMMLTLTPLRNRIAYVSWYTTIVGVVSAGGSLLGGRLNDVLHGMHYHLFGNVRLGSIHIVLLVSLVLVGISVLVLTRIREGSEKPVGFVVGRIMRPNIFRTFVNMGVIGNTSRSVRVARALREIEGRDDDIAIEEIVSRLEDPDTDVRIEAVRALGRIGSPNVVDALINQLTDPTSSVRADAARALGRIGDPRAVPYLIEGLQSASEDLQDACLQSLGSIGGNLSADAVKQMFLGSPTERLFASSAEAASRLGLIEAAWEIIPRLLKTENPVLRRQLAIATGNLIGKPGEFYKYLIGSSTQRQNELDRCFAQIQRSLRVLLRSKLTVQEEIRRQLKTLRRMITHEQYELAFAILIKAGELLLRALTDSKADEDLIDIAFQTDQRLGIWWWFLHSASEYAQDALPEFLSIDILLGLYFLAGWRSTPE
ncbi:MAG TPA: MFS transporter, partial [Spirochaetia bacterium]|nr:MFS transporter [Spirochaetia bacterium]